MPDRVIGRAPGLLALIASLTVGVSCVLPWIDVTPAMIAFSGQALDAIPSGYETRTGLVAVGGGAIAAIGSSLWVLRGRGALAPLLVVIGAGAAVIGAVYLLLETEAEFFIYASDSTGISRESMEDLLGPSLSTEAVTIEAGMGPMIAAAAAGMALILGLTGLTVASSRRMAGRAMEREEFAASRREVHDVHDRVSRESESPVGETRTAESSTAAASARDHDDPRRSI